MRQPEAHHTPTQPPCPHTLRCRPLHPHIRPPPHIRPEKGQARGVLAMAEADTKADNQGTVQMASSLVMVELAEMVAMVVSVAISRISRTMATPRLNLRMRFSKLILMVPLRS